MGPNRYTIQEVLEQKTVVELLKLRGMSTVFDQFVEVNKDIHKKNISKLPRK